MQAHAFFPPDVDPVGLADQGQDLVGDELDVVVMRLHGNLAGRSDELHARLVDEQAERLLDAREQAVAHCEREAAAGRQRDVFAACDVRRLRRGRLDSDRAGQDEMGLRKLGKIFTCALHRVILCLQHISDVLLLSAFLRQGLQCGCGVVIV